MTAALILAMGCTGLMMAVTAYFVMGSIPLLILEHDTPKDAQFVRGFFNTCYVAAAFAAAATAFSFAFAGRLGLSAGAVGLTLLALVLRRSVIPKMDFLRARIQAHQAGAIRDFRRVHGVAILVNLLQLASIVWSLIKLSIDLR